MKKHKILYGVCGIGNGHTYRQLPIIDYFSQNNLVVILAYGESFIFYLTRFKNYPNVTVLRVCVPFYVGNANGLDFKATAKHRPMTPREDSVAINAQVLDRVNNILGRPDLVISDYEPVSAQYAYAYSAPLVTIDQQSKYLVGEFSNFKNLSCKDEIMRLKMFFPLAQARIACSFFNVKKISNPTEKVFIFPPIIKDSILNLKRHINKESSILIYISSQQEFVQSLKEITAACTNIPSTQFHIFIKNNSILRKNCKNIHFYEHGDAKFNKILSTCSGIVSTAGHTLLSEAMYLQIPVFAIPLSLFEQKMNAHVIEQNKFGISAKKISVKQLRYFIKNISLFTDSIQNDKNKILLKGTNEKSIIHFLNKKILKK